MIFSFPIQVYGGTGSLSPMASCDRHGNQSNPNALLEAVLAAKGPTVIRADGAGRVLLRENWRTVAALLPSIAVRAKATSCSDIILLYLYKENSYVMQY